MNLLEFLRGTRDQATMRFEFGREFYGAFEGVFGGVIAAAMLCSARTLADGRRAASLDCQFLRSLPAGGATATAQIVRSGRALTFVRVTLVDATDHLAATAQAVFASPEALHPLDVEPDDMAMPSYAEAAQLEAIAPIMDTLASRFARTDDSSFASVMPVPWEQPDTGAEAACLAADMSVGPPVGALLVRENLRLATPNPDLSLRFLGEESVREVAGFGTLEGVVGGLANTRVAVVGPRGLIATGCSITLLLAGRGG